MTEIRNYINRKQIHKTETRKKERNNEDRDTWNYF